MGTGLAGGPLSAPVQPALSAWALSLVLQIRLGSGRQPPHPHPAGMREGPLSGAVAPKHRLVLETALLLQCPLYISQDATVSMETPAKSGDSCPCAPLCSRPRPRPSSSAPRPAGPAFPGFCFCFLICSLHLRSWGASRVLGCRLSLSGYLPASRLLCCVCCPQGH